MRPLILTDHGNQATLRVEINGRSTMLYLDTGAPRTLLDSGFYRGSLPKTGNASADELPPELRKKTNANGQSAEYAMVNSLNIGGYDLGKRPVVLTDLSLDLGRYNHAHANAAISGLLGEDILRQYGAIIDWRRRGVYFNVDKAKRIKMGPGIIAAGWTAVPMSPTSGNHYSVEATVEGTRVRLLVDTGAGFTTFMPGIVKFSHMVYHINDAVGTRLNSTAMNMHMINDRSVAYPAQVEHWKIGNYEIESSAVSVAHVPTQLLAEKSSGEGPMLGLIGAEVLAKNNAIIDIAGSTLYLKSSKH